MYDYNIIINGYTICDDKWKLENINDFYFRIYYVYGGEAYCKFNNEVINLKKGCLYFFPAKHHYSVWHNKNNPLEVLWFHVDTGVLLCSKLLEYEVKENTALYYLLEALRILSNSSSDKEVYEKTFSAFFTLICNEKEIVKYTGEHIINLVKYIENNIDKNLNVTMLSQHMGLDRSYFSRKFKKIFYVTPNQYIISRKLNRGATKLLLGSTVYEASQAAGYQDEKAFSRAFKRELGVSPSDFRSNHIVKP